MMKADIWIVPKEKMTPWFPPDVLPVREGNYQVRVVDLEHPAPDGRLVMAKWGKTFGQLDFWEIWKDEGGRRHRSFRLKGIVEWRGVASRPRVALPQESETPRVRNSLE